MYAADNAEMPYPIKERSVSTEQQESNIVGKKETPPRRGIARLCTFLSSGISNSFFRNEISKIRGIIRRAIHTEIAKAMIINTIFILIILINTQVHNGIYTDSNYNLFSEIDYSKEKYFLIETNSLLKK